MVRASRSGVGRLHEATRARSRALVWRQLFREESALLRVGRFELVRMLGRGGAGAVYEAFDRERQERLALKILHGQSPAHLLALKREFRGLAALRHPNLVALHELDVTGSDPYLTMELVDGVSFIDHVRGGLRGGEAPDSARLIDALTELCRGVHALHLAGKLHRDLKPSNVLVTTGGAVKLIDFGLVRDVEGLPAHAAGTDGYMAPEQRAGQAVEASDWYSVGRIALAALGDHAERSEASARIAGLAKSLCNEAVAARPAAAEIFETLGALRCEGGPSPSAAPHPVQPYRVPFVGRSSELMMLRAAFERTASEPSMVVLRGDSGVGKSALLSRFLRDLAPESALVLQGRCHEREAVRFKALDAVIDALCEHLLTASVEGLPAAGVAALLDVFPVLSRVPWLRAPEGQTPGASPVERRGLAFAALRAILVSLSRERPVVVCIEDLQWADEDSGDLLAALLCDEAPPRMLVVATGRAGDESVMLAAFRRAADVSLVPLPVTTIHLEPLALPEARALARAAFGGVRDEARVAAAIASESGGHPLFLLELVRAVSSGTALSSPNGVLTLPALLRHRLEALGTTALRVLQIVAVARGPVPESVAETALEGAASLATAFEELRAMGLVHRVRRGDVPFLELAHGRLVEAVSIDWTDAERARMQARLAAAFESTSDGIAEPAMELYASAGLRAEAARCALRAGDAALASLAFARAANLYHRALGFGARPPGGISVLHARHAAALEHAGHGLAAAEAYLRAAASTHDVVEALNHEVAAAFQFVSNGKFDDGVRLLRRGYAALGIAWPESRFSLTLAAASRFFSRIARRQGAAADQQRTSARVYFLGGAGRSLEMHDPLRALLNALLYVETAETSTDPAIQARVKGVVGLMRAARMLPGGKLRGFRELEEACDRARALGDGPAQVALLRQSASARAIRGEAAAALHWSLRADAVMRTLSAPHDEAWRVRGLIGSCLVDLGRYREARLHFAAADREIGLRGDVETSLYVGANPSRVALVLASGSRKLADDTLAHHGRLLRRHPWCRALAWSVAIWKVEMALYWGTPGEASGLIDAEASILFETGYAFVTKFAQLLRARARITAAAALPAGRRRESLLRRAAADTRAVRRFTGPTLRAQTLAIDGIASLVAGARRKAEAQLEASANLFDESGASLLARSVRMVRPPACAAEPFVLCRGGERALEDAGVMQGSRFVGWLFGGGRGAA